MRPLVTRVAILAVAGVLACAGPTLAQPRSRDVYVTVLDDQGLAIRGLTAPDFAVREGGKDRQVLGVEPLAAPMHVALLLDNSSAVGAGLQSLKSAATALLDQLPPEHRVALYSAGDRGAQLVAFTDSRRELHDAVQRLFRTEVPMRLIDAIDVATRDLKVAEARRPVIVAVAGTGADVSGKSAGAVIKAAAEAGIPLHIIAVRSTTPSGASGPLGRGAQGNFDRSRAQMSQLIQAGEGDRELTQVLHQGTEVTGGSLDRVASLEAVTPAIQRVLGRLGTSYRLTYATDQPARRPKNLQLGVMYEGVTVRASIPPE